MIQAEPLPRARRGATVPLSPALQTSFERDGFVRLPGALDASAVAQLRAELTRIFDAPPAHEGDLVGHSHYGHAFFDAFNRYPVLQWVPFHPPVVAALRQLLGDDFVYLPEVAIHDSGYGGWHKDTTSQEAAGLRFHLEPDYRMIQCAIYLQDNDPTYAGGLDVAPGSHRRRDRIVSPPTGPTTRFLNRVRYRLKTWDDNARRETLATRAGDVVCFDYRLDHRATPPKVRPVPASLRKLAIFMAASANNRHVRTYVDYIKSRPDYPYLKTYKTSPELLAKARANNVGLVDP
jgi:hypothetical protein